MKKMFGIMAAALAITALSGYCAGCYYFQDHFFYGTTIEGKLYGCLDEAQVRADLLGRAESYELAVHGRDGLEDVLRAADAGCTIEPQEELLKILEEQIPYQWPTAFFMPYDYELTQSVQFDEEIFSEAMKELNIFARENQKEPRNARLSAYCPDLKGYYVVEETQGSRIHREEAEEAIRDALVNLRPEIALTDKEFYDEPLLCSDDETLIRKAEQKNEYTGLVFTYDMHGLEVTVDGDEIHKWLKEEGSEVKINEDKVRAFVQKLSDTYDTYGKVREFTTVWGEKKELKSGAYGWKMDVEAEQEALIHMLEAKRDAHRKPVWLKKGYVSGSTDIGDTYVEIDLGRQHLYFVQEGEVILESDFVSGNMARGHGTPAGVFGLTYKTRNAVLRGADYATPVKYWMPFNHNIGMHDATWRGSFGGKIYQTNGSHGCINLPLARAKEIYNLVETNMPVVCYY